MREIRGPALDCVAGLARHKPCVVPWSERGPRCPPHGHVECTTRPRQSCGRLSGVSSDCLSGGTPAAIGAAWARPVVPLAKPQQRVVAVVAAWAVTIVPAGASVLVVAVGQVRLTAAAAALPGAGTVAVSGNRPCVRPAGPARERAQCEVSSLSAWASPTGLTLRSQVRCECEVNSPGRGAESQPVTRPCGASAWCPPPWTSEAD